MPSNITGPFLGYVTSETAKIWLQWGDSPSLSPRELWITVRETGPDGELIFKEKLSLKPEELNVVCSQIGGLKPDTTYFYQFSSDESLAHPLDLEGLEAADLQFRTFPTNGYTQRFDFLLMSCHNPDTSKKDGHDGFAVWSRIPQIIQENVNVRLAIMAGDQIYGDEIEDKLKTETDPSKRILLYLSVYKKFWGHISYRKVLCRIPSVMMWDDHDITDGWGSRDDSFVNETNEFNPQWAGIFDSAKTAFSLMQAKRNPEPLSPQGGFDFCFRIGRAGFCVMDLRSNRNVRIPRITTPQQREAVKTWVEANRNEIDTLFFVSTVVFSHGTPEIEGWIVKYWFIVLNLVGRLAKVPKLKGLARAFMEGVGDLRDDINDSWGAEVNGPETDLILDYLFGLQNPKEGKPLHIVILSGDIHTPGYATIYSHDTAHESRQVIPHITATPVSYKPFSWFGEAVYRRLTQTVSLGVKGLFTSQVSHHFCSRNTVLLSLRDFQNGGHLLKVKYYLEGYPEPQIMLFDLNRSSHREGISWDTTKTKDSQLISQA